MQRNIRNLLIAQIILTLMVAASIFIANPSLSAIPQALAALFGGSLLVINTILMIFKLVKSESMDAAQVQLAIYGSFIQRFLIAVAGFAIGILWLKLPPGPMVAAFGVGYLSFVFAAKYQKP